MDAKMVAIGMDECFRFSCGKGISCFGVCCRDLNQFLTPYDILKIKNRLNLSSTQFLKRYTLSHTGQRSGLPVIIFRFNDHPDSTCPFLSPSGCSIYEDRPTACRLYPIARAVSRDRETGAISANFALIQEPFCRGFECKGEQKVQEWIEDQDLEPYIRMNDRLLDLIAIKNRVRPGPLTVEQRHFFHLALYDLDRFRVEAGKGLLEGFLKKKEAEDAALMDDTALLKLGHRWTAHVLAAHFNED